MFNLSETWEDMSLCLPLTLEQRHIATRFAEQQVNAAKSLKVELNTLAVFAVKNYLDLMDIPTSLESSDSWNSAIRLCADVADLEVVGVGKLECIPILAGANDISYSEQVWEERIGYVVVEIQQSRKQAHLKGFLRELDLDSLLPLESLLDRIEEYQNLVDLKKWLDSVFEKDWQPLSQLFTQGLERSHYRLHLQNENHPNSVEAGKLIDFGLGTSPVALVLDVQPEDNSNTNICLQARPVEPGKLLPPNLELIVLDNAGNIFLEAKSRERDNYLQLVFNGRSLEHFSVQIILGDMTFREKFVI